MTYRYRTSPPAAPTRRPDGTRPNRYAGPCSYCGEEVPAGAGDLSTDRVTGAYKVTHHAPRWVGSPVSGRYVGGCAGEVAQ